jgi:hypothetical protein
MMNQRIVKVILMIIGVHISLSQVFAQQRIKKEEYIERYKNIAMQEMKRSGIPASITLAQGLIESGNGNSSLAVKANNHFGIKCHNWDKDKFYQDDDRKNECFRKYDCAEDSYRDHTDFLMNTSRYRFLFSYSSSDYKSWAHGLQKAGYATSRSYARDLIRTIEENQLYIFDTCTVDQSKTYKNITPAVEESYQVTIANRKIYERNRIKYIVVKEGDNLASLTKELDLFSWQLKKYNDLPDGYEPKPGEILYIQPKRWSAEKGNDFYIAKKGDTMHYISQLYGIKLNKLYIKNRMQPGTEPEEGQKIWLRSKKPKSAA